MNAFVPLDIPPPPSGWRVAAAILGFVLGFIAFALFLTSCSVGVDTTGQPMFSINASEVARAIIIYESGK